MTVIFSQHLVAWHLDRLRQVEYRIACGHEKRLEGRAGMHHPNLAVKVKLVFRRENTQIEPMEIIAAYTDREITLNAAHPAAQWRNASPITFCHDWQGNRPDLARQTEVRILWSKPVLYLRFECRYRDLHVFEDSAPNGRRDQLWDRDVVEAFLQPDPARTGHYREFEVSPNGMWIDLDIFPDGRADLNSGLQRSVSLDAKSQAWAAELAIPMSALTENFNPASVWSANFYRVEGTEEPRVYLAWQPTHTAKPNFHVPAAFGSLRFASPSAAAAIRKFE